MAELRIRNAKVSYSDQGDGAAVVLLHAGAGSNRQWTKLTPLLGARRIIAPDFWGFGESDPWDGADPIRHDDNADLVAALIAHLGLDRVHLVGHSYGGAPATRLVLRRPELVASLVLIEPILTPLLKHAGETVM